MTAQQGLVGRDDVLAILEGGGEDFGRGCSPPMSSTTISTAGSVTTSCQSLVKGLALNTGGFGLLPASAQARVSLRSMP